jgi:transposase
MRPKGTAAQLEQRRYRAIELLEEGYRQVQVARIVQVHRNTVGRWWKAYQEKGAQALKAKPHPGRNRKISAQQLAQLPQALLKGARSWGYPNDLWTLPRIADVIERLFGASYHPRYVWYLMRRIGWSCQKPARCAREQDRSKMARWVRYKWPGIKKSP